MTPDDRLTVALSLLRHGVPAFAGDPLGFSVNLNDPADLRRAMRSWEELAFVIEHVLEEAVVMLGIDDVQTRRQAIKDTFRGMEGIQ